jgi:hypothetical protein
LMLGSLILLLCSCTGYKAGFGGLVDRYNNISVPYIKDDLEGKLTEAVIKEIVSEGSLHYAMNGGDLVLEAEIVEIEDDNIDFRYDRDSEGAVLKKVIPTENRLTAKVKMSLMERTSGKCVWGPVFVSAHVGYDYDFNSLQSAEMTFSMGQLDVIENARDAAYKPLYKQLAEKIVHQINNTW